MKTRLDRLESTIALKTPLPSVLLYKQHAFLFLLIDFLLRFLEARDICRGISWDVNK